MKALIHTAKEYDYDFKILQMVVGINEDQKLALIHKLEHFFKSDWKGKKIAIWGLAFKPNTDDIREAPALTMIDALLDRGCQVAVFDPEAIEHVQKIYSDKIMYGHDEYQVLQGADALLIATEWAVFRSPDFQRIKSLMKSPNLFDGRNLYELDDIPPDFHYESIGRKPVTTKN